ncbi:6-phosphofructokinase [Ereboglobus sp. PH5-10]|uniref:6-phosphofructokinase n=1 Tax=Ereboglobus sp. PH5-10 TaxID=2940629 RepID=UPI0024067452|nr:ATP-dependent 6-phosphofructokinase [Ereboglobus sp. PH5-10]MDF9826641.1 6-phosphofructokinase [Ereboglobus sp. PH5-10]
MKPSKKNPKSSKKKTCIGVLTAGGDSPGLNAAIRAIGKTAIGKGWNVIGFRDGFLGMLEDRWVELKKEDLANILTVGGTVLGTSRLKPHRMGTPKGPVDVRDKLVATYKRHKLTALVCIGGGGTHKNALKLAEKGLNIVTLPKTIDNDVAHTDSTIGFATALEIATDAIDRLHSTAHSHHRIILAEIMGHRAGWLAMGAGLAGGADVILVPEIPYDVNKIAAAIKRRVARGTKFSIVAVAEGARSIEDTRAYEAARQAGKSATNAAQKRIAKTVIAKLDADHEDNIFRLARQLNTLTGLDSRVSILGYIQRGGTPSHRDRLLGTRLGTTCVERIADGKFGIMVGVDGDRITTTPISKVAGNLKTLPLDHPLIRSARHLGTNLGD